MPPGFGVDNSPSLGKAEVKSNDLLRISSGDKGLEDLQKFFALSGDEFHLIRLRTTPVADSPRPTPMIFSVDQETIVAASGPSNIPEDHPGDQAPPDRLPPPGPAPKRRVPTLIPGSVSYSFWDFFNSLRGSAPIQQLLQIPLAEALTLTREPAALDSAGQLLESIVEHPELKTGLTPELPESRLPVQIGPTLETTD